MSFIFQDFAEENQIVEVYTSVEIKCRKPNFTDTNVKIQSERDFFDENETLTFMCKTSSFTFAGMAIIGSTLIIY